MIIFILFYLIIIYYKKNTLNLELLHKTEILLIGNVYRIHSYHFLSLYKKGRKNTNGHSVRTYYYLEMKLKKKLILI